MSFDDDSCFDYACSHIESLSSDKPLILCNDSYQSSISVKERLEAAKSVNLFVTLLGASFSTAPLRFSNPHYCDRSWSPVLREREEFQLNSEEDG